MTVESILNQSCIPFDTACIDEINLPWPLNAGQKKLLDLLLKAIGFELIEIYSVAGSKRRKLDCMFFRNEGKLGNRQEKLSLVL